ncbi:MAG TPA: hypothetical protein VH592_01730 [Gemmataceae bacterium]
MIAFPFVYRLALVVVACIALGEDSRLYAQNPHLPEPIRLALVRYIDIEPLAVTWTQTTEATSTGREKIVPDELSRMLGDGLLIQHLAFRDGRIYERRETQSNSPRPPRTAEIAFDGNVFYTANNLFYAGFCGNSELNDRPYLHKWLAKNDQPEASYFHDDYFRAAGIRLPMRVTDLVPTWRPQSELLALLAEGGRVEAVGTIQLDGREVIHVQVTTGKLPENGTPPRRYDFFLDPERGHAVCRLETRDEAGRLLTRSDCTEYEQLTGCLLWLPRQCQVEEYTFASAPNGEKTMPNTFTAPSCVKKIRVTAFDVQPWPNDRFQLKNTTPGGYVNDASFPEMRDKGGVFYQVPANPELLDEVTAERRAFYHAWLSLDKRARPLRVAFLVLNGVVLAAYVIVRRRRKTSSI